VTILVHGVHDAIAHRSGSDPSSLLELRGGELDTCRQLNVPNAHVRPRKGKTVRQLGE
jgi:hypothetical protein